MLRQAKANFEHVSHSSLTLADVSAEAQTAEENARSQHTQTDADGHGRTQIIAHPVLNVNVV